MACSQLRDANKQADKLVPHVSLCLACIPLHHANKQADTFVPHVSLCLAHLRNWRMHTDRQICVTCVPLVGLPQESRIAQRENHLRYVAELPRPPEMDCDKEIQLPLRTSSGQYRPPGFQPERSIIEPARA